MAFSLDPSYLYNVMQAEGGGSNTASNPASSSSGLYGFTDPTFLQYARPYFASGTSDADILAHKNDPDLQNKAMGAMTTANAGILSSAGIQPTQPNLYAAHFLGPGGAKSVLDGNDSDPVSQYVPSSFVKANPFLNGMTVGDFKNWTAKKMGAEGGGPNPDMPAPGATAISGPLPRGLASLMANPSGQVPQQQPQGNTFGNTLMQIGGLMMAKGNPVGAQFLQTMLNNQRAQQKANTYTTDTQNPVTVGGKKYYTRTNDQTGAVDYIPDPDTSADEPDDPKPQDYKTYQANADIMANNARTADAADTIRRLIAEGKVNVTPDARAKALVANYTGNSTEESVEVKNAEAVINQQIKNILTGEKGPATSVKMQQALKQIVPTGGAYDPVTFTDAMNRIVSEGRSTYENAANTNAALVKRLPGLVGGLPDAEGNPMDADSVRQQMSDKINSWNQGEKTWQPMYQSFKKNHFSQSAGTGGTAGPPRISSKQDYDNLKSGDQYIAPDGTIRIKN